VIPTRSFSVDELLGPAGLLYRRERARYRQDGHTQRVEVDGRIESLAARLLHDDRKPLEHWLRAQARYMRLEADKLLATPFGQLGMADRVRRLVVVAPVLVFLHCLLVKGNLLDGRRGLLYALQRATAEAILSMHLVARSLAAHDRPRP